MEHDRNVDVTEGRSFPCLPGLVSAACIACSAQFLVVWNSLSPSLARMTHSASLASRRVDFAVASKGRCFPTVIRDLVEGCCFPIFLSYLAAAPAPPPAEAPVLFQCAEAALRSVAVATSGLVPSSP